MSDPAAAPEAAGDDIPVVGEHEFNALQILTAPRRQIRWIVQDLIPPGLCILAGMPKLGKSQLALNLCVWITLGEPAFGELATDQAMSSTTIWRTVETWWKAGCTSCFLRGRIFRLR